MSKTASVENKTQKSTKNIISFQKGMLVSNSKSSLSYQEQLSIQAELMQLGYMLPKEALEHVTIEWFEEVLPFIKKSIGASRSYAAFYRNFPQQVMEMSHCELFWNAILHYWSEGTWEPEYALQERGIKFENSKFNIINLGTEQDFLNIFTTLVSINQSLAEKDKAIVEWFTDNYKDNLVMPKSIPFKETLVMLASKNLDVPVKTPTDVLRIAVYLSGGDISMPKVPRPVKNIGGGYFARSIQTSQQEYRDGFKFKKFSRKDRRYLLGLLEKTNLDLGEMKLKIGRWLRLGEILHPGEYKNKFSKTAQAFSELRNNGDEIKTFYANVDKMFSQDSKEGIEFLSQRPGEFARRLDWMLRTFEPDFVLKVFKEKSTLISRKVLWELYNHFLKRDTASPRTIMLKGKRSKIQQLPTLEPMSKMLIHKIQGTILESLKLHFSSLDKLGTVWIDERLKKIPLPSAMRSVNTSIKTYIRGTRVPFGNSNAKVVRAYVHWFDEYGDEDIDLSANFYNKDLEAVTHLSYTNLKENFINSCHSGDVRQRQGACAEYIDVDIKKCLEKNIRYVIVQVHNFQNRPMHTMQDCVFGLMEREHPESNEHFVPKTISNAVKIANESSTVDVCILDLQEREYIWADIETQSRYLSNLESTKGSSGLIMRSLILGTSESLSVYDLLTLHAEARGTIVYGDTKADVYFNYDDFVTSYEKTASLM